MQNKSCLMRGRMREAPKKFSLSHRHTLKPIGKIIELLTTRATWVEWKVRGESCASALVQFELHGSWIR